MSTRSTSYEENDLCCTPPDLRCETLDMESLLPENSKDKYLLAYQNFIQWKNNKKTQSFSENVFMAYFKELSSKYKPSSLWCVYSMLKSTVRTKNGVDLKTYSNLSAYLKRLSDGFRSKKSKVLTSNDVEKFIKDAPDNQYLATKADQVQSQPQESGGGEGNAVAQPANQVPVTAEDGKIVESSTQPDIKLEEIVVKQEPVEVNRSDADLALGNDESVKENVESSTQPDIKLEEIVVKQEPVEVNLSDADLALGNDESVKENGDWQKREQELLQKIEVLEKVKHERTEDGIKLELKVREEEIDLLKARVRNLETELQAALSKPSGKNHEMIENIKQQHEELLSKARGMIFDKTKMVKNQELQIEALTTQVQSLKDINVITKDLLEIRNSEVKAMEDRLLAMEARFKAEKDRYGLVLQRAQTSTTLNDDLKKEYETQLAIFKELRQKYEQRVQALVAENTKLKELAALKPGTSG